MSASYAWYRKMVGEVFDAGASFAFEPLADDASDDDASGSEAEEAIGGAGPEDAEAEDEQEVVRYRLVVAAEDGIQVSRHHDTSHASSFKQSFLASTGRCGGRFLCASSP